MKLFDQTEISKAWRTAGFVTEPNLPAWSSHPFLAALRREFSTVWLASVRIDIDPSLWEIMVHPADWGYSQALENVLPFVAAAAKSKPLLGGTQDEFSQLSPFEATASLAAFLSQGGAYSTGVRPFTDTMPLATDFACTLVAESEPRLFLQSYYPWSTLFHGIAWDYTLMALAPASRHIHVVCCTDTD